MRGAHNDKANIALISITEVLLKVTPITVLGIPGWLTTLQKAPPPHRLRPPSVFNKHGKTRGIPELQTRGNAAIKMESS